MECFIAYKPYEIIPDININVCMRIMRIIYESKRQLL